MILVTRVCNPCRFASRVTNPCHEHMALQSPTSVHASSAALSPAPRQWLWKLQARYAPYFFVAPFVILFAIFMLYPLGSSVAMSFQKFAGPRLSRWVGVEQYRFLLTDRLFWIACLNTAIFAVLFLPMELGLSLALACLLNSGVVGGRNLLRFAFFSTY